VLPGVTPAFGFKQINSRQAASGSSGSRSSILDNVAQPSGFSTRARRPSADGRPVTPPPTPHPTTHPAGGDLLLLVRRRRLPRVHRLWCRQEGLRDRGDRHLGGAGPEGHKVPGGAGGRPEGGVAQAGGVHGARPQGGCSYWGDGGGGGCALWCAVVLGSGRFKQCAILLQLPTSCVAC